MPLSKIPKFHENWWKLFWKHLPVHPLLNKKEKSKGVHANSKYDIVKYFIPWRRKWFDHFMTGNHQTFHDGKIVSTDDRDCGENGHQGSKRCQYWGIEDNENSHRSFRVISNMCFNMFEVLKKLYWFELEKNS